MRRKWYIRSAGLALALLLLVRTAGVALAEDPGTDPAAEPVRYTDNYSAIVYNNTSGLPTSETNDIVETRDGFLWIGCYSGLIRYDGNTFELVDPTAGVPNARCLWVDSRDRLWVGTNDSGLAVLIDGTFRRWLKGEGLYAAKICDITEDGGGLIYAGTSQGISTLDDSLTPRPMEDPRVAEIYTEYLLTGPDGIVYGLSADGDLFTLRDGRVLTFLPWKDSPIRGITALRPDPDAPGKFYLGTEEGQVFYCALGESLEILNTWETAGIISALYDILPIGDDLWLCGQNGVAILDGDILCVPDDLPLNNSVDHILVDYEGDLWFTSSRQGLMKLAYNPFYDEFARYGLEDAVVNTTCMGEEGLFVGTDTGLIVLGPDGPLEALPLTEVVTASGVRLRATDLLELLRETRIRSILRDSRGRLWLSTWRSLGLLRYDKGRVTVFSDADGLLSNQVRAVCETADGAMLVANYGGVSVIREDRVMAGYGKAAGILNTETLTVAAAPNGDIVLGSNGGGIYIIHEGQTRCLSLEDGLSSDIVMRIKYDAKRDLYWLVTGNSIAYMTSDYRVTTVTNFPFSNNFDLYESGTGDIWVLSSNGLNSLPAEDLIANGENMRPTHYGLSNGLPCIATSNSYSELTPEGDLYMAGSTGVVRFNLEQPPAAPPALKAAVPCLDADGTLIYPNENGGFTLPARVHKLTVFCHVFNYALVDPMVTYRLEGFDEKSVTVDRRNLVPVVYTNLPGGTYHFQLRLSDSHGWLSNVLSVPIVKEMALHERTWFNLAATALAVVAAGTLIWLYFRRKTIQLNKKHQEEVREERMKTELGMAYQIQASMLPHDFPPFPDRSEFDIYAAMDPARAVGGDFYDFFLIDDDHLCLVMADVSGKGIPAALFMMISKIIVQNSAMLGSSASAVLARTNEALCARNQVEMFVTVWVGILEISTGVLTASNAGHERPAVGGKDGFVLLKDKHGFVIGGMEGMKYPEYQITLEPGDRLFLYTDGVPEATAEDNEMFGTDRMLEALNREPHAAPRRVLENVRAAVDAFVKDAEQFDDLTMLCLEYRGSGKDADLS